MKRQKAVAPVGFVLCLMLLLSCTDYSPKPRGFFRIEIDEPVYSLLPDSTLPYRFEISQIARIDTLPDENPLWITIRYPQLGATLYGSYLPVTKASLPDITGESRTLVSLSAKHLSGVKEQTYINADAHVWGSLFLLDEESASPIQFLLTDSLNHFFRGVYFYDVPPNPDSIAPVARYLQEEVRALMQSFVWKEQ